MKSTRYKSNLGTGVWRVAHIFHKGGLKYVRLRREDDKASFVISQPEFQQEVEACLWSPYPAIEDEF